MSDSTIGLVIEKPGKAVISVGDIVGGGHYSGSHVDIGIDMPNLHFSLTLPISDLVVLMEKAQEFLGEKKVKASEPK